ncbi:UrcA family protein [Sphingopyxis sp. BSN-002]|uniref:UrcA family protein n=1 Tax=Sphingopyxis sp. BSN-002 TaxID=2911495 RepID=UPI001EDA4B49|nr:UrcA family protein [Sphingopyxis sp. BSN-002]UKK83347.1 UrcA family protein [Sphingopyxis sp. BSN-002]
MKQMTILAVLGAALLSPAALASEPMQPLHIALGGLDLTTPRGVQAAQRRIDRAVADYCRNDVEHLTIKARRAARECRESVRGDALAQLADKRLRQLAAR